METGTIISLVLIAVAAIVVIGTIWGLLSRYRRSAPDELLVVFGKAGKMKTEDGKNCWCGVDGEYIYFRKCDDSLGDLLTNADRIRSMSNEELAAFLTGSSSGDNYNKMLKNHNIMV